MLVARGARVHTTNMGDDTPLHLAAAHGHRDIVLMVNKFLSERLFLKLTQPLLHFLAVEAQG